MSFWELRNMISSFHQVWKRDCQDLLIINISITDTLYNINYYGSLYKVIKQHLKPVTGIAYLLIEQLML